MELTFVSCSGQEARGFQRFKEKGFTPFDFVAPCSVSSFFPGRRVRQEGLNRVCSCRVDRNAVKNSSVPLGIWKQYLQPVVPICAQFWKPQSIVVQVVHLQVDATLERLLVHVRRRHPIACYQGDAFHPD